MEYITNRQRNYAHALMNDIRLHVGYLSKGLGYEALKSRYMECIDKPFSLAEGKCTKQEFEDFMLFLMDIALDYGVVTNHPMTAWADLEKWSYRCLKTNCCCVTGENGAQTYWVDRWVDNSYEDPNPAKYRRISLNQKHYNEIKKIGYDAFSELHPECVAIRCRLEGE